MLGLSNGLIYGPLFGQSEVFNYTFDFTSSGSILWEKFGSFIGGGFQGDMTIELGENPPGQSTNDWMKCTYDSDQITITGIRCDIGDINFVGGRVGDKHAISYKLFLDGDWDGSDDVDYWQNSVANRIVGSVLNSIPQDEIYTVDHPIDRTTNNQSASANSWETSVYTKYIEISSGHQDFANDRANTGAVIYIKDYNIKIYR